MEASHITIARITKTQGLKGEVRIEQILEEDSTFCPGQSVTVSRGPSGEWKTEIESFRKQHGRCVIKFRGMDSISEAEKYIGAEVQIAAAELTPPKQGWFYTFQLRGCQVFAESGDCIGTITDVLDSGGTEILKVESGNEETLIPFTQSYLKKIDLDQRRIDVDLPDDLRDLNR